MRNALQPLYIASIAAVLLVVPASESRGQLWSPLSTMARPNFSVSANETRLTALHLSDIPAGATVYITCNGNGCPFRSKSTNYAAAQSDVSHSEFNKSKLRPGATITVRVTAPNTIGKVFEWTVQRNEQPRLTTLCLPEGATKPTKC